VQLRALLPLLAVLAFPIDVFADDLRVAVASNFSGALEALSERFESASNHRLISVPGSSGKHYAQIRNGAPFDVLLSADTLRPELLESDGLAVPGSRFTYAIGVLVLWSPHRDLVDSRGAVLEQGGFRHLAIANPQLAPYGRAAREVLESRDLWDTLSGRLVRGENVSQAFQFVRTGNAELGFVGLSQLRSLGADSIPGSYWRVSQGLYQPIEQQAVLLEDTSASRAFARFLQSDDAKEIIRNLGYSTP
jgi:molybdate transport system substrate-binding protein